MLLEIGLARSRFLQISTCLCASTNLEPKFALDAAPKTGSGFGAAWRPPNCRAQSNYEELRSSLARQAREKDAGPQAIVFCPAPGRSYCASLPPELETWLARVPAATCRTQRAGTGLPPRRRLLLSPASWAPPRPSSARASKRRQRKALALELPPSPLPLPWSAPPARLRLGLRLGRGRGPRARAMSSSLPGPPALASALARFLSASRARHAAYPCGA